MLFRSTDARGPHPRLPIWSCECRVRWDTRGPHPGTPTDADASRLAQVVLHDPPVRAVAISFEGVDLARRPAVTHRGVIRAIYALARDWDMSDDPAEEMDLYALHMFTLDTQGGPRIERLNIALPIAVESGP